MIIMIRGGRVVSIHMNILCVHKSKSSISKDVFHFCIRWKTWASVFFIIDNANFTRIQCVTKARTGIIVLFTKNNTPLLCHTDSWNILPQKQFTWSPHIDHHKLVLVILFNTMAFFGHIGMCSLNGTNTCISHNNTFILWTYISSNCNSFWKGGRVQSDSAHPQRRVYDHIYCKQKSKTLPTQKCFWTVPKAKKKNEL